MRYMEVIEIRQNGLWAYVPGLPGCIAAADTESEVMQVIQEVIEMQIEDLEKQGADIPKPLSTSAYIEALAA